MMIHRTAVMKIDEDHTSLEAHSQDGIKVKGG
jgi:hypothetical protein